MLSRRHVVVCLHGVEALRRAWRISYSPQWPQAQKPCGFAILHGMEKLKQIMYGVTDVALCEAI